MAFMDLLFRNQSKWDYELACPRPMACMPRCCELVGRWACRQADADRCIAATTDEDAISKVGEDGVAKYNVNATPTFVINGKARAGFEHFFARLDAALAGK